MKDIALGDLIEILKEEVIQDKSHHTLVKRKHLLDKDMRDPQDSLMKSSSEGLPI